MRSLLRPFTRSSVYRYLTAHDHLHRNNYRIIIRHYRTRDVFGVKPFDNKSSLDENLINRIVAHDRNQSYIVQIVDEFRSKGHFLASINPLTNHHEKDDLFNNQTQLLKHFMDIHKDDLTELNVNDYVTSDINRGSLSSLINTLQKIYCSSVGVEFMHISDLGEREWFANEWEKLALNSDQVITDNERIRMAELLLKSELFDKFLATKFPTVKRYSCEGAESMLTSIDSILRMACKLYGVRSAVIGMPHRGRLNLLDLILHYPVATQFRKMSGLSEFDLDSLPRATGDVLSHLYLTTKLGYGDDCRENFAASDDHDKITVSLLPNPSHLDAISPVVVGKARSKAMRAKEGPYGLENRGGSIVLPIQIHGDASFSGQGIIMETLSMSNTPNYTVNGSIHLIVNNQLGYTTPSHVGRSSTYCSDVMKMIDAPCIHVNGDKPEDVIKASKLALMYRQTFGKDIAIDILCHRKWGHNELDDPTITNPLMYREIHSRSVTMPTMVAEKVLGKERSETISTEYAGSLNEQYKQREQYKPENPDLKGVWSQCQYPKNGFRSTWDTGAPQDLLLHVGYQSINIPPTFNLQKNLQKVLVQDRQNRLAGEKPIDWATAEALALGSLLYQGFNVRLSGQDVGRGTFSQRHGMLVDQETGQILIPLNGLSRGSLEIANSILSEQAVLGFEYGFAIDSPNNLVIWEAQFGDFFNGAQIIFDTFISSGERKWLLQNGIVILLPHGMDGAGPEHSSCRLERFLQMTDSFENKPDDDDVNWHVCHPTTPVQYFHLIRRQMIRNYRKPLIVASPKVLLRHPSCVSQLDEFAPRNHFRAVLPDPMRNIDESKVKKVIFCCGKHFYTLEAERSKRKLPNVSIIRIEELCPFPMSEIHDQLKRYSGARGKFLSY